MRARSVWLCLVFPTLASIGASSGCTRRGPRDVGNQNPRSEFVDGPGSATSHRDASAEPARIPARPIPAGRKPRVLATADTRAIATDGTHVYFGDADDDALFAIAKEPKRPEEPAEPIRIARRAPMPGALSVDTHEAALAWIGTPGDVVFRVPAKGGAPTTIRDRGIFTDVAASNGDVFFTEVQGNSGILTRATGTTTARLATFEGAPRGIAVDADNVYVATSSHLYATPRTRGAVSDLARGTGFSSPQVDAKWLYATAVEPKGRTRLLVRATKAGGALETVASGVRDAPIAVHGGVVYWFDAARPALLSTQVSGAVAPAGSPPAVVAEDAMLEHPSALAVDDDGAFVVTGNGEGGRVVVIPLR